MKKNNFLKMILITIIITVLCFTSFGCHTSSPDDDQTLEIYIGNYGYGTEWLESVIDLFKKEDWVKEKYPNLRILDIKTNSNETFVSDNIDSEGTTIDLFFTCRSAINSYFKTNSKGVSNYENLNDLYEMEIPNESVTVGEKLVPAFKEMYQVENKDGSKNYYSLPWAMGLMGLLYNKSLLDEKLPNYDMPNTTNELLQMTTDLKEESLIPFVFCAAEDYMRYNLMTWWAQYEGIENYSRFWKALNEDDEFSNCNFAQQGRLESLKVLESLFKFENNNYSSNVNSWTFTQAQAEFLLGRGIIQPNGDWFENEMRQVMNENNNEITFMKLPVISSIIDKCTTINDDAKLSEVISAIDNGENSVDGVSNEDFKLIYNARKTINCIEGHEIYIPSYSKAKVLAKDFLRFFASDTAINEYMKITNGASLAFNYEIKEKDIDLYNSLPLMQKDKLDIINNANVLFGKTILLWWNSILQN